MTFLRAVGFIYFSSFSFLYLAASDKYKQELRNFKTSAQYQVAFDENVNSSLGRITADIETRKQLSYIYRFLYPALSGAGAIAINRETMPSLYAYIESVCIKQHMAVPYIFISRDVTFKQGLFNAFAQKLLASTGCVVIGQRLMLETTDAELEAIVAHELGHIKYNHVNKTVALCVGMDILLGRLGVYEGDPWKSARLLPSRFNFSPSKSLTIYHKYRNFGS